jgi:hypothetical protein
MNNYPSREDFDPYFYDPDSELEARDRMRFIRDREDWEDYEGFRQDQEEAENNAAGSVANP